MSVITLYGQLMRHQSPVRSRARSEHFYARTVRVQLHTRVFLKFKSSCTVRTHSNVHSAYNYTLVIIGDFRMVLCYTNNIDSKCQNSRNSLTSY